jgi:hypothetical protein
MLENTANTGVWLTFASLAVAVFTLTILFLIFLLLRREMDKPAAPDSGLWPFSPATNAAVVSTKVSGAALLVEAQKTRAQLKPGRSCGHCGVRLKGDPVRGIALDEKSYLVYACPDCKKETLLPQ